MVWVAPTRPTWTKVAQLIWKIMPDLPAIGLIILNLTDFCFCANKHPPETPRMLQENAPIRQEALTSP